MIISASRRTDIPNYYSEWFYNRLMEGFICVRNPMNHKQISKIDLSPELVDCIVFWTKNPRNMIDRLENLEKYNYYIQFSLTGYGHDIEPFLPDKKNHIIPTFRELSNMTILCDCISEHDTVKERAVKSFKIAQLDFKDII